MVGGMERLIWHMVDELRREFRVHVIGPNGCSERLPPDVSSTEIHLKPTFWYLIWTMLATLRLSLRFHPRIVLAGSGLTAPFAWLAARITGARCVVYLHGLDIEADQLVYRLVWRPFFRRFDSVLVNSRFTQDLARDIGILSERIVILHPGVAMPDFHDRLQARAVFRDHHMIGDAPLMLYVGRLTARKGLATFVRDILPQVLVTKPNAKLVVIGDEPLQALHHRGGEHQRVVQALQANNLHPHVTFLREVDDTGLNSAYFAADVLVFPVQERTNDHEGFGMVALEAAAHGLQTVAFAVGGVTDAVSDGISGNLISPGDNRAFSKAILNHLETHASAKTTCGDDITAFAATLAWPTFGRKLRALCQRHWNNAQ